MIRRWGALSISAALATTLFLTGCRKQSAKTPAAPPLPSVSTSPAPQAPPQTVKAPEVEVPSAGPSQLPAPPAAGAQGVPAEAPPKPASTNSKRSSSRSRTAADKSSGASALPPAAEPDASKHEAAKPPETVPELGEVLSPDLRNAYYRELEANLSETRTLLKALSSEKSDPARQETINRVKNFVDQAEDFRRRDLRTAVSLSRRALILARELGSSQ